MPVDGLDGGCHVAESGRKERSPRVSTRFSLGVENEWTDAGRDGQTCLERHVYIPVQLTMSRIGNHICLVDPQSAECDDLTH